MSPTGRAVLRSGNNTNANNGVVYVNANNASSNSNTNNGSRLANNAKKKPPSSPRHTVTGWQTDATRDQSHSNSTDGGKLKKHGCK